jgi:predicted transposase YbfD/YdcC
LASAVLAELDLHGRVVTGDAQFCQRALCAQIVAAGGEYFVVVKENQPTLLADVVTLFALPPWGDPRPANLRTSRGHGRTELRLLRCSAALRGYTDWPGLGYACCVQRVVTRAGQTTDEEAYAVTSLTPRRTTAAQLQALWRGHWGIENRLHWIRDETLGEDRCQVRTGHAPQALAALRNTVIGVVRRAGHGNVAAALRSYAANPAAALARLGLAL